MTSWHVILIASDLHCEMEFNCLNVSLQGQIMLGMLQPPQVVIFLFNFKIYFSILK